MNSHCENGENGESHGGIKLRGSVWMTVNGHSMGGAGRIRLLTLIAAKGSISQAAKVMGMSYKAAWDAIDTMNQLAGEPLVHRLVGGRGGGGTHLTERGKRLVRSFGVVEEAHRRFIDHLSEQAYGLDKDFDNFDDLLLIQRIGMRTSARNQFFGTVSRITTGAVNDEIVLDVPGMHEPLIAVITHGSAADLNLELGSQAFALVKATSVVLAANADGIQFSTRNRLQGEVLRVHQGAVNSEVVLGLPGGATVAAILTNASCAELRLVLGAKAWAIFKASSVIISVPV